MGIGKPSNPRRAVTRLAPAALAALAAITLAACGGSGKPAYCSARSDLQNSIKGLTSLNASSGVSGVKEQVSKIQTNATTLVNQAKGDFPSETSAISSSVSTLETAVKSLSSSPSATQIAAVASAATSVVTSVEKFYASTAGKCA